MNKKILTFLIVFLVLFSYSFSQAKQIKIIAEKANVYLDSSKSSYLIETLGKGTILDIYGSGEATRISRDWYNVYYKSKRMGSVVTGFIEASKVELLEPPKTVETEQEEAVEEKTIPKLMKESKTKEKKPETAEVEKTPKISPKTPSKTKAPKEITVKPRSGIGIFASYAMPSEGDYGSGLAFGLNFHLGITKNIAVELGGLAYKSNIERNPTGLSQGKLSVIPIQLSLQARFPVSSKIIPYIRGGAGYSMNNFTINNGVTTQWNNLGYDIIETVENSIEYHFGAGIDILVHKNIALNGDVRYLISNTKGTWTFKNQVINTENSGNLNELNLNTFTIGIGFKYLF